MSNITDIKTKYDKHSFEGEAREKAHDLLKFLEGGLKEGFITQEMERFFIATTNGLNNIILLSQEKELKDNFVKAVDEHIEGCQKGLEEAQKARQKNIDKRFKLIDKDNKKIAEDFTVLKGYLWDPRSWTKALDKLKDAKIKEQQESIKRMQNMHQGNPQGPPTQFGDMK